MIKIMVCDDNRSEIRAITNLLYECYEKEALALVSFENSTQADAYIAAGNPVDIAFLDIIMPELSGIELAARMRQHGFGGFLVFLTSVNDFAAQANSVKAFSYLLKPVARDTLQKVLDEMAVEYATMDTAGFEVTKRGENRFILFSELVYVEVVKHNLYFHLLNGEVLTVSASLLTYAGRLLSDSRMTQNHRSSIINMDYIVTCEHRSVVMRNGDRISVPKNFKAFQNRYFNWIFSTSRNIDQ